MPKVKVCCIPSLEEAELAIRNGADALGLVSEMPSGPGVISEDRIAEIAAAAPGHIETFLLTSLQRAEAIAEQHRRCRTTTIQLVDELPEGAHRELRKALNGIKIVQVIHVTGKESITKALKIASVVDALLLDSGNPDLKVKELGGTGRTHNWDISRQIVQKAKKPVYLAGGLNPENVSEAVRNVAPFGLDVCSGLRSDGNLDPVKVEAFFEQVRGTAR